MRKERTMSRGDTVGSPDLRNYHVDGYSNKEYFPADYGSLGYRWMKRLKPSSEYVLLGTLYPRPKHGYEIKQFLEIALESTWHVSQSQLYALLKGLEERELLQSNVQIQDARPPKRTFSLTAEGKKHFQDWLITPTSHVRHFRMEFFGKLFFFYHLSLKGGRKLIDLQIQEFKGLRAKISRLEELKEDSFGKLALSFKVETLDSHLRWLESRAKPFLEQIEHG